MRDGVMQSRQSFPRPLYPAVAMEFAAIFRGNGFDSIFFPYTQFDGPLLGLLQGNPLELSNANEATTPLHNGEYSGLCRPVDRIDLPVTDP